MFYKITKEGNAIDIFTDIVACKYEPRSRCILGCGINDSPMGIVSNRLGSYYHVDGWDDFPFECQTVILSNISESEYNELKEKFAKEDADSEKIAQVREELRKTNDATAITFVKMAENGIIDEVTAAEHAEMFIPWAISVGYEANAIHSYGDCLYKCLQAHTSQAGWEPDKTASLWKKIGDTTVEYPEWSQPVGAGDGYEYGAKVSHVNKHWHSEFNGENIWEPGAVGTEALWVEDA